ncbi:MAG: type 4a pilus biogenesis protein PilO [Polyangiaceae bacterium]
MATPAPSFLTKLPVAAKLGVGAAVVAVVFFGYWFVFYSEIAGKIEGAQRQKKALRDQLAQEEQAEATYFADRGELALREQRARELNKVLPPDSEEDAFLSSVQQASNAAGIDLKSYTPSEEIAQPFYAKVPMRLEMSGRFQQIVKFAYELGKVDRIINVENIELAEPKVNGDEIVLRARCLATAFHALRPKEAARGPGDAQPGAK